METPTMFRVDISIKVSLNKHRCKTKDSMLPRLRGGIFYLSFVWRRGGFQCCCFCVLEVAESMWPFLVSDVLWFNCLKTGYVCGCRYIQVIERSCTESCSGPLVVSQDHNQRVSSVRQFASRLMYPVQSLCQFYYHIIWFLSIQNGIMLWYNSLEPIAETISTFVMHTWYIV